MRAGSLHVLPLILMTAAGLASPPGLATAVACGNPVTLTGDKAVQRVKAAEADLAAGRLAKAMAAVNGWDYDFEDDALYARASLVYGTAGIRLAKTESDLEAAIGDLAGMESMRMRGVASAGSYSAGGAKAAKPDHGSPLLAARRAEGLLRFRDARADEGAEIILALEADDLIPDAGGWRAAAAAHTEAGDAEAAGKAMARCRKAAGKRAKAFCVAQPKVESDAELEAEDEAAEAAAAKATTAKAASGAAKVGGAAVASGSTP